jgi:putative spermidine/putrescine transport system permease protein
VAVIAEYAWKESAFVTLVVLAAIAAHERELDEAAAVLGAPPWQRLRRVALPLAAPATAAAGGISFAYVLGSYEVAWLLGRTYPEPLPVLAYRLYTDVDLTRRDQAMAVALLTTLIAVAALLASLALLHRTAMARTAATR